MKLEDLVQCRKDALINKDFSMLCKCAIEMAKVFSGESDPRRYCSQEAAFFLGRINDRIQFEELIYKPYLTLSPSLRPFRSFEMEEKMYDMGRRYPFLDESELDFLEELYCSPSTYDMINRMLYDGDEVLRRKLARFDANLYEIKHGSFSKKLCLDIFNALVKNEFECNIDEAIEERRESIVDKKEKANLFGYDFELYYTPILVYNRRTNSVQVDETDLSDSFLIPVSDFCYAEIMMSDAVDLIEEYFGKEIVSAVIYPTLEENHLNPSHLKWTAFCAYWFLPLERAIVKKCRIETNDCRLSEIRVKIAQKWLIFQNEKSLR